MIKEGTKTNNAEKKEHRKGNKFVSGLILIRCELIFFKASRLYIATYSKRLKTLLKSKSVV